MIFLFIIITIIILISSLIPLIQLFYSMKESLTEQTVFNFDKELFDHDTDNIKFENVSAFQGIKNNRALVTARGSIRQANGNVIDTELFDQLKNEVYSIELP